MTRLRPVHDKIIVRRLRTEEKVGSLYVPEANREKPTRGEVLAVGPGRYTPHEFTPPQGMTGVRVSVERTPMCCKPGDVIVFGKYAGSETDDVLIISDSDVLAVEEREAAATSNSITITRDAMERNRVTYTGGQP